MLRRVTAILITACALCLLSGCVAMSSVDDLYQLPQVADEYIRLQELLDAEIASGSEYAAPTEGNYRQSVQQADLDGDGVGEVLAFFRDAERTPTLCIYRREGDEDYERVLTISGEGTEIGRVEYADLDSNGDTELLVAWQIGQGMSILRAYSFTNLEMTQMLIADCVEYRVTDLNDDGSEELFVLSVDTATGSRIDMYRFGSRGAEITGAPLSHSLASVDRIRSGLLSDGHSGLFVEGPSSGGGLMTDVLALTGSELVNVTLGESGNSPTVRAAPVYSSDVDGDGVGEVPAVVSVAGPDGGEYSYYDWYVFDSAGNRSLKLSTYHCTEDGWYLALTDELRENATIRRTRSRAGETAVVFYKLDETTGETKDLLAIYTLTGDNRYDRAELGERFTLDSVGGTVYSGELLGCTATRDDIRMSFRLIFAEWITGEM